MTDKEIADVIKDMVVLYDTREQKNQHILEFFDLSKIAYRREKLDTGDYTFVLPHYPELKLDGAILIEKKNSLDEIAGNLTKDRERFIREFERVEREHFHLVVEEASWKKLLNGKYRSKFTPASFMASMLTIHMRYGVPIWFVGKDESPMLIYGIMYYELREHLKGL